MLETHREALQCPHTHTDTYLFSTSQQQHSGHTCVGCEGLPTGQLHARLQLRLSSRSSLRVTSGLKALPQQRLQCVWLPAVGQAAVQDHHRQPHPLPVPLQRGAWLQGLTHCMQARPA
jgi:hypothetical protein